MGFVYEEVGEENRELWESIGWKNWGERPIEFYKKTEWVIDRERNIFMQPIGGGFRDMPFYYDLAYKGRIVRTEALSWADINDEQRRNVFWNINKILIPQSLWNEKKTVITLVKEAFLANNCGISPDRIKSINVNLPNEAQCVEVDYNGR